MVEKPISSLEIFYYLSTVYSKYTYKPIWWHVKKTQLYMIHYCSSARYRKFLRVLWMKFMHLKSRIKSDFFKKNYILNTFTLSVLRMKALYIHSPIYVPFKFFFVDVISFAYDPNINLYAHSKNTTVFGDIL